MAQPTVKSPLSRFLNIFGPIEDLRSPLWLVRLCPAIAVITLSLAQTIWRSGAAHDFCVGLATGQLGVLAISSFQITNVTYKNVEQPSDVQDLRITR